MTAQAILGPYLYLGFPKITVSTGWFLGIVVLVAMFCGLAGALFAKLLLWINNYRKRFTTLRQQAGWVAGCGLLLAGIAFWAGTDAFGTGKPIINRLLFQNDHLTAWYLFPVRFAGMALSYSSGAAGGIFATSLSAGAILGDGLARLARVTPSDTNLVILVSMVSFLTGVVRSPFTAAILVLEMTDRHSAIFQLLLGGLMAQTAASFVDPDSFYEHLKEGFLREAIIHSKASEQAVREVEA